MPLALACGLAVAHAQMRPITVDVAAAYSTPPVEAVWSPDGRQFAFPQAGTLYLYDVAAKSRRDLISLSVLSSAATTVAEPEAFAWQNRGVEERDVQWFPSGDALLVSAGGDLFQLRLTGGQPAQLTATRERESDPKLSPDGRRVSFRRGDDLYTLEIASRKVTRLTRGGTETIRNGRLDWVYPEELGLATAHWWSPDSTRIAYLQFDVSRQPLYPHASLLPLRPIYEPQRYPKAGEPNAVVRVGVVSAKSGKTRWMDAGGTSDTLFVQRLNRIQNRLDLLRVDAASGKAAVVLTEQDPHWVNLGPGPWFLKDGAEFLWTSERDGFHHIYRYSAEGELLAQLTSGDWEVTGLCAVNEAAGHVFYVSTEASPLERHLYRVSLAGGVRARLTAEAGTHVISAPPRGVYFLDTASSLASPPRRTVLDDSGAEWAVLDNSARDALDDYDLRPAEIVAVRAADGTLLYAKLIRPAGFQPGRKYPAVVFVYGGPHSQNVRDVWQGPSLEQVLAHRGFVVWQLDNRGSAGRGHAWEAALYRELGVKEMADQQDGVRHLVSLGFVDEARVGVYGWSYGGFLTLYSLLHAPDLFRAGVAGAPVTDWRNYDTIYTERYMGLPSENAEGYRRSAPVAAAANLKARLLLVHNLEDDNVLFQNTVQMADALQRAGHPFEMMIYPQRTHGVTGTARRHMMNGIISFFERWLSP